DRSWRLTEHLEHECGLQNDRVSMRAALPAFEHRSKVLGIVGRIAALQILRSAARQGELLRASLRTRHLPWPHVEQCERTDRGRFVPAWLTVYDVRALDRQTRERVRHDLGDFDTVSADQMEGRLRGIRERAENVEHRAHA